MAAELEPGAPGHYPLKPNPWAELAPEALDASHEAYLQSLRDPRATTTEQRINEVLAQGPRAIETPRTEPRYPQKGPQYRPGIARDVLADLRSETSMDLQELDAAVNGPTHPAPVIPVQPEMVALSAGSSFPRRRVGGGTQSRALSSGAPATTGTGTALLERIATQANPSSNDETMRLRVDPSALETTQPIDTSGAKTPIGNAAYYSNTLGARILSGEAFVDTKNAQSPLFDALEAERGYDPAPVTVPGISTAETQFFPLPEQFANGPEAARHRGTAMRMRAAFSSQRQTPIAETTEPDTVVADTHAVTEPETTTPNEHTLESAPQSLGAFAAQFAAKIRAQQAGSPESVQVPDLNADPEEFIPDFEPYKLRTTPYFTPPRGVSPHEDYPHRQDFATSFLPLAKETLIINSRITEYAAQTSTAKLRRMMGREALPETTQETTVIPSPVDQAREALEQALATDPELSIEAEETLLTAPEDSEFAKLREELDTFRKEMNDTAPAVTLTGNVREHAGLAAMTTDASAQTAAIEIPHTFYQQRTQRRGIMGLVDRFLRRR